MPGVAGKDAERYFVMCLLASRNRFLTERGWLERVAASRVS